MTASQLLVTKLYIPPLSQALVPRRRLVEKLNGALLHRFTAVVAPAGFGKTTLLVEWVNQVKLPVTWVSLDAGDNDPVSLLSYLIASLRALSEKFGENILAALDSPDIPPIKSLLTSFINEVSKELGEFILVLDDFHWIDDEAVVNAFAYLVNYLPRQMHLVVASRSALPGAFARLRAGGQLIELNTSELRFRIDETTQFLRTLLGSSISSEDIALLGKNTEGWIAGLQMAAISCQSAADIHDNITVFSGDDRYIADYLVEQVLSNQPEHIQRFLLQTSVLDRMSAPLCNALVGIENSQSILGYLEQANLFIVPLDNQCKWYRYHHLFAELLQNRLKRTEAENYSHLRRRACEWYLSQGKNMEAIEQALNVHEYELSAKLVEAMVDEVLFTGMAAKVLAWLARIPDDVICHRPRLAISRFWLFAHASRAVAAEQWFNKITPLLSPIPPNQLHLNRSVQESDIDSLAAIMQGVMASYRGQMQDAIGYHKVALELLPKQYEIWRIVNWVNLAIAYRETEDYTSAKDALTRASEHSLAAGSIFFAIIALSSLAQLYLEEGNLGLAVETCQRAFRLVPKDKLAGYPVLVPTSIIIGQALYDLGELDTALGYFQIGVDLAVQNGRTMDLLDGLFYIARIQHAKRNLMAVLEILARIKQLVPASDAPSLLVKVVRAYQAYLLLACGRIEEAEACSPHPEDILAPIDQEIKTLYQTQHASFIIARNLKFYSPMQIRLTLARLYIATQKYHEALAILDEQANWVKQSRRYRYLIEILILQAKALQELGDSSHAIKALRQAVESASAEGFTQTFIDEGPAIRTLLKLTYDDLDKDRPVENTTTSQTSFTTGIYITRLLSYFKTSDTGIKPADPYNESPVIAFEALTSREIDVLTLLADGLSYSLIAERLSISKNTVRTYIKNIYGKLRVNNRVQAIQSARKRGYLA